jgi:rare lipoprotein A
VAAWAVALGVFLILVASATAHGATTGGATLAPAQDGGSTPAPAGVGAALPSGISRRELVARMSVHVATWYGPGFYGRRTACGVRLRRSTEGAAHMRLPCGTRVTFYYRGRISTVPVIDRGPHTHGISWDLTAATARTLGLRRAGPIRSLAWSTAGAPLPSR